MFTTLELPLFSLYVIERFCYVWSDITVEFWETFTEYNSELLVSYTDLLYRVEYMPSPLARWVLELF
nr:MAG TPA: hypothetical protein [Caudoviricetes sp.]